MGIVLNGALACVDLDGVRDPISGEITETALEIVRRFDSYTEVSLSGTGLHIFCRGSVPGEGRNNGRGIEVYSDRRFIALTGVALSGYEGKPRECQEQIDGLLEEFFPPAAIPGADGNAEDEDPVERQPEIPVSERVNQARRYLDSVEPAIEGAGGDLRTYTVIVNLIRGFDLDGPEGERLVEEFNQTKCVPVWDPVELRRKMDLARTKSRVPRGCLLVPRFQLTDTGNAARMARLCGHDLRYCRESGFLVYIGGRWVSDDGDRVLAMTKSVAADIWNEAEKIAAGNLRKAVRRHAIKTESRAARRAIIDLLPAERCIAVSASELDRDPRLFNVKNGTLDLRTGTIRDFDRNDLMTKQSPVSWDPTAECPRFLLFLLEIFDGSRDLIAFVQRVVGYALTGLVTEQCLFFFFGAGRNGKSTLIELLLSLFGDYGIQAAPELLSLRKGEVHPTEQADLFGVRLAAAQEVKEGGRWDERAVKALTGGDRIRSRRMRQDFFEFPPTHKFIIAANHKPQILGVDLGIWRRIVLVPFTKTITEKDCDRHLPEKLRAELPGILRWAVEGCIEWQRVGLAPPPEVLDATSGYKHEMDLVGRFLDDECTTGPSVRQDNAQLYQAFTSWCKEVGESPLSARLFGDRLAERGHPLRKVGGVKYRVGVREANLGVLSSPTPVSDPAIPPVPESAEGREAGGLGDGRRKTGGD